MKHRLSLLPSLVVSCFLIGFGAGCGAGKPPKEIAATDIPTESRNLFAKAAPEVRELAGKALAALDAQDWATAWVTFQAIGQRQDLTPEQRQFVASAVMTLGAEMQKAGAQGDERAQAVQRMHTISK
ncbi:MAG: hypothetical protein IPM17_00820 [Verrucomicrobia bacterium]|nr:hypothetical protein [Verrucomicrobiota bacterium]